MRLRKRQSHWWILVVVFLLQCAGTFAHAEPARAPLRAWLLAPGPTLPDQDEVLRGEHDASFSEIDPAHLRLGPPGRIFWLRLAASPVEAAPRSGTREGHWLLAFDRVAAESIEVFLRGDDIWEAEAESFFRPGTQAPSLGGGYFFRLPTVDIDRVSIYVRLVTDVRIDPAPRLQREGDALASDRQLSNLFTAIYTTLLVLLVINLILYAALRDAAYLAFVAWCSACTLLVLGANGHLYGIPGLRLLGGWGVLGVHAFALLAAASSVWLFRAFVESPRHTPRLDQGLKWFGFALLAMVLLCLPNVRAWAGWMQILVSLLVGAGAIALWLAAVVVWRAGGRMARGFFLVWLLVAPLVLLRVAVAVADVPAHGIAMYGFQVGLALAAFLFSIALAERVIEFRQQRDRARLLKEQTDATLRIEQTRRTFVDDMRKQLVDATSSDAEWVVLRRLLVDLRPLIPQQAAAVVVKGHDGMDFLFSEPAEEKAHFARLLEARVDALRGICRSRAPMVVKLEEPGEGGAAPRSSTFAVVPLALHRSGWGALLLERSHWEEFSVEELKVAQELSSLALRTAHEVVSQVNLQREAESDPLTGALNRRAGDAALEAALRQSIQQRLPLAVLFIDLDHFKAVNDMHGHAVGDRCLTVLAEVVADKLGSGDSLARYGGEEFQVVLPGRTLAQARAVAESIRQAVAQTRIDYNGVRLRVTVSIGVAQRQAEDGSIQELQERADKALYKAKANGRNCVATLAPTDLGSFGGPGVF